MVLNTRTSFKIGKLWGSTFWEVEIYSPALKEMLYEGGRQAHRSMDLGQLNS